MNARKLGLALGVLFGVCCSALNGILDLVDGVNGGGVISLGTYFHPFRRAISTRSQAF